MAVILVKNVLPLLQPALMILILLMPMEGKPAVSLTLPVLLPVMKEILPQVTVKLAVAAAASSTGIVPAQNAAGTTAEEPIHGAQPEAGLV